MFKNNDFLYMMDFVSDNWRCDLTWLPFTF